MIKRESRARTANIAPIGSSGQPTQLVKARDGGHMIQPYIMMRLLLEMAVSKDKLIDVSFPHDGRQSRHLPLTVLRSRLSDLGSVPTAASSALFLEGPIYDGPGLLPRYLPRDPVLNHGFRGSSV